MPRNTRAAAKAQLIHSDDAPEEANIPLPPTPKRDREPLRSITPHSVDSVDNERPEEEEMAKTKGKKGRKGNGKKKGKKATVDKAQDVHEQVMDTLPESPVDLGHEPAVPGSPASDESTEDHKEEVSVTEEEQITDERPASPSVKAMRMTRSRLAKREETIDPPQAEVQAEDEKEDLSSTCTPTVEDEPEPKDSTKSLDETSPELASSEPASSESASSEAARSPAKSIPEPLLLHPLTKSLSVSPSLQLSQPEDPIEAIDALEDAIEEVGKILPALDSPVSPRKPPTKRTESSKATETGMPKPNSVNSKTSPSSTSKARASTLNKLTTSTQPSATSRPHVPPSLAKSTAPTVRSTNTKPRPSSVIIKPRESRTNKEGEAANFSTSKRRPISLQFPTPPPPPKSKKPPTQSNFSLPGDAIAAKLKAARAERLKREEEEAAKRKEFKARPVPGGVKPKPFEVKQTASSRARLSMAGNTETSGNKENNGFGGLKRSSTVTGATSKRNSVIANSSSKRSSVIANGKKDIPPLSVPKRQTTITSNTTANRASSMTSSMNSLKSRSTSVTLNTKTTVTPQDVAFQRQKGKEVFNRDKVEKESREKERKEKDEAMKKARAEAAERGRQASREWAEKQKKLMEKKKSDQTQPEGQPVAV